MYEDKTYANVLKTTLARAPAGVSTRQGDIFFDAVSAVDWDVSELYFDLAHLFELVFLSTTKKSFLDEWGWQTGVSRNPATCSVYKFIYEGARPSPGTRFFADMQYFILREDEDGELVLESEATGKATSTILEGTQAVPMENIRGLTMAQVGEIITPGIDTEDDDHYRERIRDKLAGPAENGNAAHYKLWCESIAGVGRAKIVPLFAGENTVMAVLFDPDGMPCVKSVCEEVQEYVDPITKGKTVEYEGQTLIVGDGLGNGKANIGAHFYATAATGVTINITAKVTLATGYTVADAKSQADEAIKGYFRSVALDGMSDSSTAIKWAAIGARLLQCDAIEDYSELQLNGGEANVVIGSLSAPLLGEVAISETV